jgi:ABC-type Fe3+/spermidine/putrescine transport system ATPase subunit
MQSVLTKLQKELGITFVYVTHSQSEAFAMADRVIVNRHSKGTPDRRTKGTPFVRKEDAPGGDARSRLA